MPVRSGNSSGVGRGDVGVVRIIGGDLDEGILDLRDRAPDGCLMHYKALS